MSAWRWLFGRRGAEHDLARETESHIAERVDDLVADGWSEADATMQARREFGNRTLQIERSREVWIAPWMSGIWQDTRYGVRALRRQPLFTLGAILILALGTGPVTALFTAFNTIVLRPWPVRDPSSIAIVRPIAGPKDRYGSLSNLEYRYFRDHSRSFVNLATWVPGGAEVAYRTTHVRVQTNFVSANYFDMLGVRMQIGRAFLPDEDDYTSPLAVAVISERLWREYFGAPAGIVGETLLVNGYAFTIVGVAEAGFFDIDTHIRRDVWMPRTAVALMYGRCDAELKTLSDPRAASGMERVAGRLAPGATRAAALAEIEVLGRQFRSAHSLEWFGYTLHSTRPISIGGESIAAQLRPLPTIGLALALVLVLACANVGNLLIARGLSRRREIAIRVSLGASRARVVRQLLTEVFLLSVLAGAAGLWLGAFALRITTRTQSSSTLIVNPDRYAVDLLVFAFAFLTAFVTCLAAGLLPALRTTRPGLFSRAAESGVARASAGRLRTMLLAAQFAVSMILLVGAGLFTRAIAHATALDVGFAMREVQAISLRLPEGSQASRLAALYRTVRDTVDAGDFPPVAFSEMTAITSSFRTIDFRRPEDAAGTGRAILARDVSPEYFKVLGIPQLQGRPFAAPIGGSSGELLREIIVNESAARLFWPDENPLGRRLVSPGSDGPTDATVVGVVKDVPVRSISEVEPVVYRPFRPGGLLLVRDLSPSVADRIGTIARAIDPAAIVAARRLAADIKESTRAAVYASRLAWAIGLLALILATAGAFGVFAYVVEERRREIGVRMALGAQAHQVVWTIVSAARGAAIVGIGAGLLLSFLAAPLLDRFLYGFSPFDPVTYAGISAILIAAALAATWIPARRATQIDPAITLRAD
jgi:predicted permease